MLIYLKIEICWFMKIEKKREKAHHIHKLFFSSKHNTQNYQLLHPPAKGKSTHIHKWRGIPNHPHQSSEGPASPPWRQECTRLWMTATKYQKGIKYRRMPTLQTRSQSTLLVPVVLWLSWAHYWKLGHIMFAVGQINFDCLLKGGTSSFWEDEWTGTDWSPYKFDQQ